MRTREIQDRVSPDFVTRLTKSSNFFEIAELFSAALNIAIFVQGGPIYKSYYLELTPKKLSTLTYEKALLQILEVFGYSFYRDKSIYCYKNFYLSEDIPCITGAEFAGYLDGGARLLKRLGLSPLAKERGDDALRSYFLTLTVAEQKEILDSYEPKSKYPKEYVRQIVKSMSEPKGKRTLDKPIIALNPAQRQLLSGCFNKSTLQHEYFTLNRGLDLLQRISSPTSSFQYTKRTYFEALTNIRQSNGKTFQTALSPVSRIQQNFGSVAISDMPLNERDPSDPAPDDYLPDGKPKPAYLYSEEYSHKLSELDALPFLKNYTLNIDPRISENRISVVGVAYARVEELAEALRRLYNYAVRVDTNTIAIAIKPPRPIRSLSELPQAIEEIEVPQLTQLYRAWTPDVSVYSDRLTRINSGIRNLRTAAVRRFRIVFDATLKNSPRSSVKWKDLPDECRYDAFLAFGIEAIVALENIRAFRPIRITDDLVVSHSAWKSGQSTGLQLRLYDPKSKQEAFSSGFIVAP